MNIYKDSDRSKGTSENLEIMEKSELKLTIKYYFFEILKSLNLLFSGIWKFCILLF